MSNGLESYSHEIAVLLRLIRKKGVLTEEKFDELYQSPYRSGRGYAVSGDTLILGMCAQGISEWSFHLDLLQRLVAQGLVNTSTVDGMVVYTLSDGCNESL